MHTNTMVRHDDPSLDDEAALDAAREEAERRLANQWRPKETAKGGHADSVDDPVKEAEDRINHMWRRGA